MRMNHVSPDFGPRRVAPVEPDLLATALFLFSEYLDRVTQDATAFESDEEEGEKDGEEGPEIDTRAVLDLFAEELGTDVPTTLNLYLRTTALFQLLSSSRRGSTSMSSGPPARARRISTPANSARPSRATSSLCRA
jgi:hypothetical protein